MKFRRPGLQGKREHVVNSLENIIPAYELGSNRIALLADTEMRIQAVKFAAKKGSLILALGSGLLSRFFHEIRMATMQLGGAIVVTCAGTA